MSRALPGVFSLGKPGFSAGLQANAMFENSMRDKSRAPAIAAGQNIISASVTVSFELD
jgi:uncharacterized protein YggE